MQWRCNLFSLNVYSLCFYITKGCLHIKLKRMFQYIILIFFKCFPLHVNNKNEKEILLVSRIIYIFSTDDANHVKVEAHWPLLPTHPRIKEQKFVNLDVFFIHTKCASGILSRMELWSSINNFHCQCLEFFLLFTTFNWNRDSMTKWLYWEHITSDS